jgi:hypothetical protein
MCTGGPCRYWIPQIHGRGRREEGVADPRAQSLPSFQQPRNQPTLPQDVRNSVMALFWPVWGLYWELYWELY